MDTNTALTVLGGAIGGAKVVEKLLGPTADYIGGGVKNWTEKRIDNVSRIFSVAARRLGDGIDEVGSVPPKILKGILDEGSFCDDELAAEYFGGVLASSRSNVSRDDRGATYCALLARLSTYQIRAHYGFYTIIKKLHERTNHPINMSYTGNREKLTAHIPEPTYRALMDFNEGEDGRLLVSHIMSGLVKELLITELHGVGSTAFMRVRIAKTEFHPEVAISIIPTLPGIELFLWANGKPNLSFEEFFDPATQFEPIEGINIPEGAFKVPR